ncbi:ANTAR domain-containing protein [Mycolicibacterium sp. XJ1819]
MPGPEFHPRQHPQLVSLLRRILERVSDDLRGTVGLTVTVSDRRYVEEPSVIASLGAGADMVDAQLSGLGGPVVDALTHQLPVISLDMWTDERWPKLTLDAVTAHAPGHRSEWEQVHGAAAVPGFWQDESAVVISATLTEPADAATVSTLISYEHLVSAALVTAAAESATAFEDLLTVLQSRGAIEQAKGALMGLMGCDAETAWNMLRRASQEFNVKLRDLAVALLEHVSGAPAEQPNTAEHIAPDTATRRAAAMLWAALKDPASQHQSH